MKVADLFETAGPFDPVEDDDQTRLHDLLSAITMMEHAGEHLSRMFSSGIAEHVSLLDRRRFFMLEPWSKDVGIEKLPQNAREIKRAQRWLRNYVNALHTLSTIQIPARTAMRNNLLHIEKWFEDVMMDSISEANAIANNYPNTLYRPAQLSHAQMEDTSRWKLVFNHEPYVYYTKEEYLGFDLIQRMMELNELVKKLRRQLAAVKKL